MRLFCLMLCAIIWSNHAHGECRFSSTESVFPLEPGQNLYIWHGESMALLEPSDEIGPLLSRYRTEINEVVPDTDPVVLLERQRDRFVEASGVAAGVAYNQVISGALGDLRPMSCLETLLMEVQLSGLPRLSALAEFQSNITLSEDGTLLNIYAAFVSDISPPDRNYLLPYLQADLQEGYSYYAHLHNHPFYLDNPTLDVAGTLIPSGTLYGFGDIFVYNQYRELFDLDLMWITNGFDSVSFEGREIGLFR